MPNDPKYLPTDKGLVHIAGGYVVPAEEPVMILRGKDPIAILAIQVYIDNAVDEEHRRSSTERLEAIRAYQAKYPHRTKVGCHLCGDEPEAVDAPAGSIAPCPTGYTPVNRADKATTSDTVG